MESLNPEDLTVYPQQKLSAYSSPSVLNAKNAVTKFYDQPSWGLRPIPGGCDIISQNTDWSAIPSSEIKVISFAEAVCDTLIDAFTQEYRVVGATNLTSDQKKEFTDRAIGRMIPTFDEWNKVATNESKFFIIKNQTVYDDLTRLSTTRRVKTNGRWAPGASDVSEAMSILMNAESNGASAVEQVNARNAERQQAMDGMDVSFGQIRNEIASPSL